MSLLALWFTALELFCAAVFVTRENRIEGVMGMVLAMFAGFNIRGMLQNLLSEKKTDEHLFSKSD